MKNTNVLLLLTLLCSIAVLFSTTLKEDSRASNISPVNSPQGLPIHEQFDMTAVDLPDNCRTMDFPLSGKVLTEEDEPVELVEVSVYDSNGMLYYTYTTDKDGAFLVFTNDTINFTLAAKRLDNPKNGVSTLDLVRIQKHLLGIEKLDSPYKMIAADANNSQTISAVDLIEIRKLILGINTEFSNNDSWRFVRSEYMFSIGEDPWPFEEVIEIGAENYNSFDFIGVKVGDVNGTVDPNANQIEVRDAKGVLELVTQDRQVQANEVVKVSFSAQQVSKLLGYQFTMETQGMSYMAIESGTAEITTENLGVFEDALTMSWSKPGGINMSTSADLFTLIFSVDRNGMLSEMLSINSRYTEAEAYNEAEEILDIELTFLNGVAGSGNFALHQNHPNPFSEYTEITFDLPYASEVTVKISDAAGKLVQVIKGAYGKGTNTMSLNGKSLGGGNVFYYSLSAGAYTGTKKMVLIR